MSVLTYMVNGKIFDLSSDDRKPFNNNETMHRVDINSRTVFNLKDGANVIGIVKNIVYSYPQPFSDNPLQSKFEVEQEKGGKIDIWFYEIENHSPAPFKPKSNFK